MTLSPGTAPDDHGLMTRPPLIPHATRHSEQFQVWVRTAQLHSAPCPLTPEICGICNQTIDFDGDRWVHRSPVLYGPAHDGRPD